MVDQIRSGGSLQSVLIGDLNDSDSMMRYEHKIVVY